MSEYQAMRVEQAIAAEINRISDYVATAAAGRTRRPSMCWCSRCTTPNSPRASLDELQRVRWALSLTQENYTALRQHQQQPD
jgi:hypothetical protein